MVKNKRDFLTPRKRTTLLRKQIILDRNITKDVSTAKTTTSRTVSTANIKVIVRVRPTNNREQGENCRQVVEVVQDDMLVFDPEEAPTGFFFHGVQQKGRDLLKKPRKNMKFNFDTVYSESSTTDEVFKGTTYSLINSLMDGYNCSVFAYGATGAGKTYTMTGNSNSPGITFLTMTELFKKQEELAAERDFELGITYLEVYNELVKDLLHPGPPLNLREDSNYGVIVAGIKVFKINNANELFSLLQQGNKNRTQHPTDSNAESSRSHAVFQVYLKMTTKRTKELRTAKLSMIDLAGSERGSATGYVGARFTEGANINKSLLALGNCINSLADGHGHVPYRDSKLTRLLKDCLGGNCQTIMIANISSSSLSYEDTYNTLKYAMRASSIKASLHRNISKANLNVLQYVKLVEELTKENETLKQETQTIKQEVQTEKSKNDILEKECSRLKLEVKFTSTLGPIEESLVNAIKALVQQKRDLLERRFQLERNESSTALRRLIKEEIDSRLSDVCPSTLEKNETRDKINSTITRFKKKETVLRDDIEKAEDDTDEIDMKLDELEIQNPQCSLLIQNEKLKLELRRSEHRLLLEQRCSEILLEENVDKAQLMDKMGNQLRTFFELLHGHGYSTPGLTRKYKDLVSSLQGRKNIKWSELPNSEVCAMTSSVDDEERQFTVLDQTYSTSSTLEVEMGKSKTNSSEAIKITGLQSSKIVLHRLGTKQSKPGISPKPGMRSPGMRSPKCKSESNLHKLPAKSPRLLCRSPKDKENLIRKPFEKPKSVVNQSGAKGITKNRPMTTVNRPRFRS